MYIFDAQRLADGTAIECCVLDKLESLVSRPSSMGSTTSKTKQKKKKKKRLLLSIGSMSTYSPVREHQCLVTFASTTHSTHHRQKLKILNDKCCPVQFSICQSSSEKWKLYAEYIVMVESFCPFILVIVILVWLNCHIVVSFISVFIIYLLNQNRSFPRQHPERFSQLRRLTIMYEQGVFL